MVQTLVMAMVALISVSLLAVLVVRVTDRPESESGPESEPAPAADSKTVSEDRAEPGRDVAAAGADAPAAVAPRSEEAMAEISAEAFGPLEPLVGGAWETGEAGTVSWSRSVFRPLLGGSFVEHRQWGIPEEGAPAVLISQTIYRYDSSSDMLTADGYARNGTTSERTLEIGEPLPPEDVADEADGRSFSAKAVALIGYATEETVDDLFEYRQEIVIDPATPDRYVWRVFRSPLGELEWTPTAAFEFVRGGGGAEND